MTNSTVVQLSTQHAKLLRRLEHLPPGRYELVITVGAGAEPLDWSLRSWGKVEK